MSQGEHILIVEDDPDVGQILDELLQEHGYRTTLAVSLATAHGALADTRIDLVLCDMLLPDGNAEIDLRCHTPCLFMAGHPEAVQRMEEGGSHHLAKPFTAQRLLTAIRDCLDRGQCSRRIAL